MTFGRFEVQFFAALLFLSAAFVAFVVYPCLDALVIAIALAVIFHPLYAKLLRLIPKWGGLAAIITVILALFVILAPLTFFGFRIFTEAQGLYASFTLGNKGPLLEFLHGKLVKLAPGFNLDLTQYTRQILSLLLGNLGLIFSKIVSVFGTFFLALFALYYLLKDGAKLRKAIIKISPLSPENSAEIVDHLRTMASSVIIGTVAMAVIHGVLVGFGFLLFELPNPVLWGSVAVVAAFIPIVGTAVVVVPGVLSLILAQNFAGAIGLTLWGILMLGFIDNILRPRLIERRSKAHPLLVLLSVIGGLALFGPTGFLLGPLALSLFLTLLEIYPSFILEQGGKTAPR